MKIYASQMQRVVLLVILKCFTLTLATTIQRSDAAPRYVPRNVAYTFDKSAVERETAFQKQAAPATTTTTLGPTTTTLRPTTSTLRPTTPTITPTTTTLRPTIPTTTPITITLPSLITTTIDSVGNTSALPCKHGQYYVNRHDANAFDMCINNVRYTYSCPPQMIFDSTTKVCATSKYNSGCEYPNIWLSDTYYPHSEPNKYYYSSYGGSSLTIHTCPPKLLWDVSLNECAAIPDAVIADCAYNYHQCVCQYPDPCTPFSSYPHTQPNKYYRCLHPSITTPLGHGFVPRLFECNNGTWWSLPTKTCVLKSEAIVAPCTTSN